MLKKMEKQKRTAAVVCCIACGMMLISSGCSAGGGAGDTGRQAGSAPAEGSDFLADSGKILLDSAPDYQLTAVESLQTFFSLPFYRICTEEELASSELGEEQEFTVGEDAELSGPGTDALNGASVGFLQQPLTEAAGDRESYEKELADSFQIRFGRELDEKALASFLDQNLEELYLTTFYITFDGTVGQDIQIEQLDIPDIDFSFDFQNFSIDVTACDADIRNDDGDVISYTAYSGAFMDRFIPETGYVHIEGKAEKAVEDMQFLSLDDRSIAVTEENAGELGEQHHLGQAEIQEMQKPLQKQLSVGERTDQDLYYLLSGDKSEHGKTDGLAASLVFQTKADGTTYWYYICQPSVVEGKYLLANLLQ